MGFETAIIMIVGVCALVALRLVLNHVGRDFRSDHVQAKNSVAKAPTMQRQQGRNRHLLALGDLEPLPETKP